MANENRRIIRSDFDTEAEALAALSGKDGSRVYARDINAWLFNDGGTIRYEQEYAQEVSDLTAAVGALTIGVGELANDVSTLGNEVDALEVAIDNIPQGPQGPQGPASPIFGKTTLPNGTLPEYIENYAVRNPLMLIECIDNYNLITFNALRFYLSNANARGDNSQWFYRFFESENWFVQFYDTEAEADAGTLGDETHVAVCDLGPGGIVSPGWFKVESVAAEDMTWAFIQFREELDISGFAAETHNIYAINTSYQFNKNTVAVGDSYELEVVLNLDTGTWGQEEDIRFFPFLTSGDGGLIPLASESGDVLGFFFPSAFIKGFVKANGWEGPFVLTVCVEITSVAEDSIGVRTWVKNPMPIGPIVQQETITMTATGFDGTAPTAQVKFTRIGDDVKRDIVQFSGTSNADTMTLTGSVPAWALPAARSWALTQVLDNSAASVSIYSMETDGTIVFHSGIGGSFTTSGLKGIGQGFSDGVISASYAGAPRSDLLILAHETTVDPTGLPETIYFGMDFVASGSGLTAINPMSASIKQYPAPAAV